MGRIKLIDKLARAGRLGRWLLALLLFLYLLYLWLLSPSHDGVWSPLQNRLPQIETRENSIGVSYHISNLRDFRYHIDGSVREKNYVKRSYALVDLERVWFGISHFGKYGLAHTFLSFEFAGDNFLAASVEARLRPDQNYHPLLGLMRQYNKLVVLGTEMDVIGVRTAIRQERVLFYPLQLSIEQRNYLFTAVMEDAQAIAARPTFYNTLLDKCTTNLLKHDPGYRFYTSLLDYRLLLPGYSDEVAYEKAWLDNIFSLEELRLNAAINNAQVTLEDPLRFSQVIRQGLVNKQAVAAKFSGRW